VATEFTIKKLEALPKYIRFGKDGCAMRLYNPEHRAFFGWRSNIAEYYRDAGCWSVDIRIDKINGKIYSICKTMDWLHNVELMPTSYSYWKKDNAGYISKTTKAHYIEYKKKKPKADKELPY